MTRWQHSGTGEWCDHDISLPGEEPEACGCITPTPDPASPCGERLPARHIRGQSRICGQRAVAHIHVATHGVFDRHPHVPTRCLCGHPIEEIPDDPA